MASKENVIPVPEEAVGAPLAAIDETAVSFRGAVYTQTPQFTPDDMLLPKLRLGQGLTPEVMDGNGRAGQWFMTGYDAMTSPTVIPLMVGKKRRRVKQGDQDRTILCSSPDAIHGIGDPGIACAECPFSKWSPNPGGGRNNPPECDLIYSYPCYVVEAGTFAIVEFSRTSEGAAKLLNLLSQSKGLGKFAVRLDAVQQKNDRYQYYQAQPRRVDVDPAEYELAKEFVA